MEINNVFSLFLYNRKPQHYIFWQNHMLFVWSELIFREVGIYSPLDFLKYFIILYKTYFYVEENCNGKRCDSS